MSRSQHAVDAHIELRSDFELLAAYRAGDREASAPLFERHQDAARTVARSILRDASDVEDAVSEAFSKVFGAIDNGRGPTEDFRAYLYLAVRTCSYDTLARQKTAHPLDEGSEFVGIDLSGADDPVIRSFDATAAGRAFASLPERWRAVLWATEIEGRSPADVGVQMGMRANAVAALAYRAREGLRQAFLAEHAGATQATTCRDVRGRLGAYVRGASSARDTARIEAHLEHCDACALVLLEVQEVDTTLVHSIGILLLPIAALAGLQDLAAAGSATAAGSAAAGGAVRPPGTRTIQPLVAAAVVFGLLLVAVIVGASVIGGSTDGTTPVAAPEGSDVPSAESTDPGVPPAGDDPVPAAPIDRPAANVRPTTTTTSPVRSGPSPVEPTATAPVAPAATTTTTAPKRSVPVVDPPPPPTTVPPTTVPPTTVPPTTLPPPVIVTADLAVEAEPVGPITAGGRNVVVVTVASRGPDRAASTLALTLPPGASVESIESDDATCSQDRCEVDPVDPDDRATVVVTLQLAGDATAALVAELRTDAVDPTTDDHRASVDLTPTANSAALHTRYVTAGRVALTATGNTSVSCNLLVPGCADARARIGGSLLNNSWSLIKLDTDDDPTTSQSSSAPLSLPAGARVRHASLVWGGSIGSSTAPDGPVSHVRFGSSAYTTITAEDVTIDAAGAYQSVADVTDLVASGGADTYWVADVASTTTTGSWGGWMLSVVYDHPDLPDQVVMLADGLRFTGGSVTSAEVTVSSERSIRMRQVLLGLWDGDPGTPTPERIEIRGEGGPPLALFDASNPVGDVANSTVSIGGVCPVGVEANTFGTDLDLFEIDDVPRSGASARFVPDPSDRVGIGLLGITFAWA